MRGTSLCVALFLCASSAQAQERGPIRTSIERSTAPVSDRADDQASAARDSGDQKPTQAPPKTRGPAGSKNALFWSGLAVGVAGVTTSTLGLTALRTDRTSTGNAPDAAYRNCVALRDSDPIYATSQCGVLKGKNLRLLWSGVAIGGAGAALMVLGRETRAEIAPDHVGLFHRWRF
jgi:hypothetical protein